MIGLAPQNDGTWDLELDPADNPLEEAVAISILTEAAAREFDGAERRGWWGNSYPGVPGFELGSRLWELAGVTLTDDALAEVEVRTREALQWLLTDGAVADFELEVERGGDDRIAFAITGTQPDGEAFSLHWELALNGL